MQLVTRRTAAMLRKEDHYVRNEFILAVRRCCNKFKYWVTYTLVLASEIFFFYCIGYLDLLFVATSCLKYSRTYFCSEVPLSGFK